MSEIEASVLITGGTGGLGTAVVRRFSSDGWRVVAPCRGRPVYGRA